jgi:hypothetical protein
MNGKKLARLLDTLTGCIHQLSNENDALRVSLKRISSYQSVDKMRRDSEKDWGLPFEEALEMAYENVITEAKNGLSWKPARPTISKHEISGKTDPEAPISRDGV